MGLLQIRYFITENFPSLPDSYVKLKRTVLCVCFVQVDKPGVFDSSPHPVTVPENKEIGAAAASAQIWVRRFQMFSPGKKRVAAFNKKSM